MRFPDLSNCYCLRGRNGSLLCLFRKINIFPAMEGKHERAALEKPGNVSGSKLFAGSKRDPGFPGYVVRETVVRSAYRLKGYTISLEVFDRGFNFAAERSSVVRAWMPAAGLRLANQPPCRNLFGQQPGSQSTHKAPEATDCRSADPVS